METHPAFLRIEPLLLARGFRLLESKSWENPKTDSKFVKYKRGEIIVFLVLDRGAWGSGIWFEPEGGARYGEDTAVWARWIGAPLNDVTSNEDEAQFILEHVDDVEREVRKSGVEAVDAFKRALERSRDETADRAVPLIRESLRRAPRIRPEAFNDEAWIACALHWNQAEGRRIGFESPTRLSDLVYWGDGHLHYVPAAEQIHAGLAQLMERGWVEIRRRNDEADQAKRVAELGGRIPPGEFDLVTLREEALATIASIAGSGRRDVRVHAMEAWLRANPLPVGD